MCVRVRECTQARVHLYAARHAFCVCIEQASPMNTRLAGAAYLGGFVGRAKFLPLHHITQVGRTRPRLSHARQAVE